VLPPSLLAGDNADFLDDQYRAWVEDPASVEPAWAAFFEGLVADGTLDAPNGAGVAQFPGPDARSVFGGGRGGVTEAEARRQAAVVQMINAWRVRGHFVADIDPLGRRELEQHPELTYGWHGLRETDLDATVSTGNLVGIESSAKLSDVLDHLRAAYGDAIAVEYMNIDDNEQKRWVQERIEYLPHQEVLDAEGEARVLRKLSDAEAFEQMLHTRFPGTKRFSLEGGETVIPLLDLLITHCADHGVREIVFGMAHRGRLNVLTNIMEKPPRRIVEEFEDSRGPVQGSGDVKYHLGYSADIVTIHGKPVHLSLTPNPSHLEAVNPVVEGRVRAKQDRVGDTDRRGTLPVLLHGDAAFVGQGSVMENFQLSGLDGYTTGGTIHVVINNQVGFTTGPKSGRSSNYASDVARMMAIPILHVNGEHPRAVAAAVKLASEWRQTFGRDVVIDMYCYRKHGHNEGDEPSFTQPLMYEVIRSRPTPRAVYAEHLVTRGHMTQAEADQIFAESRDSFAERIAPPEVNELPVSRVDLPDDKGEDPDQALYAEQGKAPESEANPVDDHVEVEEVSPVKGRWETYTDGAIDEEVDTGIPLDELQAWMEKANAVPKGFTPHNKINRLVKQRLQVARGERPVDWAMAEQAAMATLAVEGFAVRLSGQDSGRGTFSQRHAVWTDAKTGQIHRPLSVLSEDQGRVEVLDSHLSEMAVLGFEYGFSLDTPDALVMWEAQFGDFSNGAQVIIDQFITSSEQKWGRLSGLVMLLPHAFEGQGPEHSSARLERFLLQGAQDNIQVANVSTPANYFHLLRRQVVRHVRKPLVLMTPKSLLRHPRCTSTREEMAEGRFQRVIADPRDLDRSALRKVVFCSGHVYYDIIAELESRGGDDTIAIHRVELLYPFPAAEMAALLEGVPEGAELVWAQEEPKNMGAWPLFCQWFPEHLSSHGPVRYVGRPAAASPATGSHTQHKREQEALVSDALA